MNLYYLILPILFKNIKTFTLRYGRYMKICQIILLLKKKQIEKDFFIKYYKTNKNVNFCSV